MLTTYTKSLIRDELDTTGQLSAATTARIKAELDVPDVPPGQWVVLLDTTWTIRPTVPKDHDPRAREGFI